MLTIGYLQVWVSAQKLDLLIRDGSLQCLPIPVLARDHLSKLATDKWAWESDSWIQRSSQSTSLHEEDWSSSSWILLEDDWIVHSRRSRSHISLNTSNWLEESWTEYRRSRDASHFLLKEKAKYCSVYYQVTLVTYHEVYKKSKCKQVIEPQR
jgi:hypothetical protein